MTPKKIAICEDHALFSDGLRVLLSFHPQLQLAGQATDEQSLTPLIESGANVVLLDLNLGNADGFAILQNLRKRFTAVKVLILTMHEDEFLIDKAKRLGANGYLLKNSNNQELISAIDALENEDFYLPASLKNLKAMHGRQRAEFVEKMKLTNRETEIITLIAQGLSSADIAEKLFVSPHTVRTHNKNILKKLGLGKTSDLVRFAFQNHML